ncbi:MAG: hypothetical protein LUD76_03220 [Alistipes sp.]|nr:hypothetical protein [Alistipes sp.]
MSPAPDFHVPGCFGEVLFG